MMTAQHSLTLGQTSWILDHRKAAFLPAHKLLILSDVHLGKVQHFRKNGIAVPVQAAAKNLILMQELLETYQPESILFLGDLFHSQDNSEHQMLDQLHIAFPKIKLLLVPGNHDLAMLQRLPTYLKTTESSHQIDQLIFSHHPPEVLKTNFFYCYGHLHPAVEVHVSAGQRLKFPSFLYSTAAMVMPAFGSFTGSVAVNHHLKQANKALCTPEGLWLIENKKNQEDATSR